MRPTPDDPDAWYAYLAEGNRTQARKRVAADALIRNRAGHVLLVKPTYKPGWDLPGGMAEANEAPEAALARELREELGLDAALRKLLVVDWVPPHGPWDDQIAFIFDVETLDDAQAAEVRPHDDELSEAAFLPIDKALVLLRSRMRNRLAAAIRAGKTGHPVYLHDGHSILPTQPGLG
ncbi:NUDIX hydrolase [Streptomyces sp. NBC_01207]|uniref:NUDIX hydrolase n=1 Tax=Streptomyces sp. NBC_01207 TaxID=2903772 RepID=UPI002E0D52AF|nr:NUDIX hydrolase [Streptomyces sp. NBC_01207]